MPDRNVPIPDFLSRRRPVFTKACASPKVGEESHPAVKGSISKWNAQCVYVYIHMLLSLSMSAIRVYSEA